MTPINQLIKEYRTFSTCVYLDDEFLLTQHLENGCLRNLNDALYNYCVENNAYIADYGKMEPPSAYSYPDTRCWEEGPLGNFPSVSRYIIDNRLRSFDEETPKQRYTLVYAVKVLMKPYNTPGDSKMVDRDVEQLIAKAYVDERAKDQAIIDKKFNSKRSVVKDNIIIGALIAIPILVGLSLIYSAYH